MNCLLVGYRRCCPVIINNNWLRNQRIRRVTQLTLWLFQNNPAISLVTSPFIHCYFSDHSLVCCLLGVLLTRPQTISLTSWHQSFRPAIYTLQLCDDDVLKSFSIDAYTELFKSAVTRVLYVCNQRSHMCSMSVLHCGLKQDVKGRTIAFHYLMRRVPPSERADASRDVSVDPDYLRTV